MFLTTLSRIRRYLTSPVTPTIRSHEAFMRTRGFAAHGFIFRWKQNGWHFGDDSHQPYGPYDDRVSALGAARRVRERIQGQLEMCARKPLRVNLFIK